MPNYRRRRTGSLYFFTLVTQARRHILTTEAGRRALHDAMERTRSDRPWVTEAIVLLPDVSDLIIWPLHQAS